MPSSRSPLLIVCLAALATAAAGCSGPVEPPPEPSPAGPDREAAFEELNEAVAGIAEEQAELSPPMAELLSELRSVDRAVAAMRDPERIDGAVDAWPPVTGELGTDELEPVRAAARELAADVDASRIELARVRSWLDDEWERRYLDAQDVVLQEVRAYAEASDALAQILARHVPTYREVLDRTGAFVERRGFYRSAEEASDAYEVEIGQLLDDLSAARQQIARFVEERDDAAVDVNVASAEAADVFADRPADPSPSPSPP